MGKGAKREEKIQELEEINHNIQAENAELRRLLQVVEEEKQELQERSQLHGEVLNKIIEELQLRIASQG
jgi:flagellar biosynthesis/type III secretory pathway chaperone